MLITVTNKMSKHWFHRISVCEFDLINLWTCLSWNTCAFYSEWYVELSYDVTREYFALNRSDSVPFIQPESAGWKRSLNTPGIKLFLKQRRFIHFMRLPRKWRLYRSNEVKLCQTYLSEEFSKEVILEGVFASIFIIEYLGSYRYLKC